MSHQPVGTPPHLNKPGDLAWQQYNSNLARIVRTIQETLDLLGQDAISNATSSSVSVTSSDIAAIATADANTASGTATAGGYGFVSDTEFNTAITNINTIKTLANDLKTNIATIRTLANELKADLNTLKTDVNAVVTNQNALIAALQTAGIIT